MKRLSLLLVALVSVYVSGLETAPSRKESQQYCQTHDCPPAEGMSSQQKIMADRLKLVIFLGSTREGRLGERVKKFVMNKLKTEYSSKFETTVYDPADEETKFPLLQKAFHYYEKTTDAPPLLQRCNADIENADAFLLISCEYNHSIPPALSNMLDHFPAMSYAFRPSALLTYSPSQFGGIRAAMQLRAMTGELGCTSISKILAIPKVHEAIDADGKPNDDYLNKEFTSLMSQLEWTAAAFKEKKNKDGLPANL